MPPKKLGRHFAFLDRILTFARYTRPIKAKEAMYAKTIDCRSLDMRRTFIPRRLRELLHSGQYAPAVTGCCRKPV